MGCSLVKRSAYAILDAVAQSKGYARPDIMARTRVPELDVLRVTAYVALRDEKGWGASRIARLFDRDKGGIHRAMKRHDERSKIVDLASQHTPYVEELEAQIRRMSGCELSHQVAHRLGFASWQAVFLSCLMESYPSVITVEKLCTLYDWAFERLYVSDRDPVAPDMVKQFVSKLRKWCVTQGLSEPITRVNPGGIILTDEMALWLHNQFGKPVYVAEAA